MLVQGWFRRAAGRRFPAIGQGLADRRGATAAEFSLLAFPFLACLFASLETATIFMAELTLDNGVNVVGREIRTGAITGANLSKEDFRARICKEVNILLDCSKLLIDLKTYGTFADISTATPVKNGDIDSSGFGYVLPTGRSVVALRVYYKWPIYTAFMRDYYTTMNDRSAVVVGVSAFQTEAY